MLKLELIWALVLQTSAFMVWRVIHYLDLTNQ